MKRRRSKIQLTEKQQLMVALVLVIMVAVSLLYCLALASLVVRQSLDQMPATGDTVPGTEGSLQGPPFMSRAHVLSSTMISSVRDEREPERGLRTRSRLF